MRFSAFDGLDDTALAAFAAANTVAGEDGRSRLRLQDDTSPHRGRTATTAGERTDLPRGSALSLVV